MTGKTYTQEESDLLAAALLKDASNTASQEYGTAITAITNYYTAVTGGMTDSGFTSEAYATAVDNYKTKYDAGNVGQPGYVGIPADVGVNTVTEAQAEAAKNYHDAVLAVVYQARLVVDNEKAAAQAIKDEGIAPIVQWFTDLETAMQVFANVKIQDAVEKKDDKRFDTAVLPINGDTKSVGKTATKDAYALLIQYTTFTLDKCYPGSSASKTLKEISDLCDKAAILIEKTGDVSFDPLKTENAELAVARQMAIEWVGIAKKDKTYEDGKPIQNKKMPYDEAKNADQVYASVNGLYNDLSADLAEFKYSYGDIADTLAEVAAAVDANLYGSNTAAIKAAAEEIAFTLSTFEDTSDDGNLVFDDDRNFLAANRLRTKTGRKVQTGAEKSFAKKYDALLAAIEAATAEPETPEVVKGDLTGDGVATPEDAVMIVKAFVGEITLTDAQKAAADFNGDGVVTPEDALAVVKAYVGL